MKKVATSLCLGTMIAIVSVAYAQTLSAPTFLRLASNPGDGYVHGEEIGAHNTGWRGLGITEQDLTPHNGVFTEPGVYENLDINGPIHIKADNVTIRGFRVRYSGATYGAQYYPTWNSGYSNATLEYGEIVGNTTESGNSGSIGVLLHGPSNTTRRLHVHGFRIGIRFSGSHLAENCYVEKLHYTTDSHNTSFSVRVGDVVMRGNRLVDGNSAALAIYAKDAPIHNVDVVDNFFQTPKAHYCVNFGLTDSSKPYSYNSGNFHAINNVWGQDYYATGCKGAPYWGWANDRSGNEWRSNRLADGTPL